MSYCRFGSDNWRSDVYCYESKAGYETHVACKRVVGEIPPLADIFGDPDEFLHSYMMRNIALDKAERVPIGLPEDGQSFIDDTLEEFLDRLLALREMGYHVPESAIDEVRAEMAEQQAMEVS